jgi:sigma-B regulation protein RsbU (phosphoserine phosphatase)
MLGKAHEQTKEPDKFQLRMGLDLSVCLADVSGKAMDAAISVVMFSGVLNSQMEDPRPLSDRFDRLNRSLYRSLDPRTFICFEMAEFDAVSRTVLYTNAGCPYPYLYRAVDDSVQEIESDNYPLGVTPEQVYQTVEINLALGDVVVFCSDEIAEEINDQNEQFGYPRTQSVVLDACRAGMSADHILSAVETFRGKKLQSDDMTCVVVRVAG